MKPDVVPFFHAATNTYAYVVSDPATRAAAIIDPVLDYEPRSGRSATLFADALVAHVHEKKLAPAWILETHAHADHLSAGDYLREQLGAKLAIGAGIVAVQRHFKQLFNLGGEVAADGSQFDHLFGDGEEFTLGAIAARALGTPGHTPDSMTYCIGDAAFVGDTLFAPDVGTARCDFPGGDARMLYGSIQRILALPATTRLFLAHDYPTAGRQPRAQTDIAEQRAANIHLAGQDEAGYVLLRETRDRTLAAPQLLLPALQVNIRGGRLPPAEGNGIAYLRIPLNAT
jgi:glyoxylase-like metal-dependent hydrolase (beta-lactamase superfamily II)